jgi:peroxiredoxin
MSHAMPTSLLIIRLLLASVFTLAAVGKLLDVRGTRSGLLEFGVPETLAPAGAVMLPAAEIVTAALLLVTPSGRAGAFLSSALLACFAIAVGGARLRGESPDCHCFGAVHSAPAGVSTLLRIGVLGALAALVVIRGPGRDLGDVLGGMGGPVIAAVLAAGAVIVAQAALSWELLRRHGRLVERIRELEGPARPTAGRAGLQIGSLAPTFKLTDLDGAPRSLEEFLIPGRSLILAFSEPACSACSALPATLARSQAERDDETEIVLISRGTGAENVARLDGDRPVTVLLQREREVAERFGVVSVPCAMAIDSDGRVASRLAVSLPAIRRLLGEPADRTGDAPLLEVIA